MTEVARTWRWLGPLAVAARAAGMALQHPAAFLSPAGQLPPVRLMCMLQVADIVQGLLNNTQAQALWLAVPC